MLNELSIENVAVIEKAEVRFGAGLNVLTGETGAGKSILIDSINAILGNRTSRELVRSGASKAAVWATFTELPAEARAALEAAGYDAEDELLLYREIGADGKTSCRVNGRPATAAILREIGASLLTIHGQHDNQSLLTPSKHLGILDGYAQHEALLQEYGQAYRALREVEKQITALSMDEGEKQRRLDLLRYQVEEIEAADLVEGEEEQLTEQRNKIRHSQKILDSLGAAYAALQGGEEFQGGVDLLGEAGGQVEGIGALSEEFSSLAEKLNDLYYSAQDLAAEIKDMLDGFDFDPSQLEEIEGRLDLLHGLKRKYGQSVGEVLSFYEKARAELDTIEFSDQKLAELTERRDRLYRGAAALAERLSRARKKAFEGFSAEIAACLQFLNMPGIRLALACQKVPLGPAGQDDLEFYISTNPGEEPKPLAKIASGGELSRIMLAIKSVMAEKDHIPTVIYDEIDTGVSGLAAGRIGQKLRETAESGHQVICITHTAQIAAYAKSHLLIEKAVENQRTYTSVRALEEEDRVRELARIISGDRVTELALANAREMLQLAGA